MRLGRPVGDALGYTGSKEDPWGDVSEDNREALIRQARACGLTLDEFIGSLVATHERMIREALFGDEPSKVMVVRVPVG